MPLYRNQKESNLKLSFKKWNNIPDDKKNSLIQSLNKGITIKAITNEQTQTVNYKKYILLLKDGFYFECFSKENLTTTPNTFVTIETNIKDKQNNTICSVKIETYINNSVNQNENIIPLLSNDNNGNPINEIFVHVNESEEQSKKNFENICYSEFNEIAKQNNIVLPYSTSFFEQNYYRFNYQTIGILENCPECLKDVYIQNTEIVKHGTKATCKYPADDEDTTLITAQTIDETQFFNNKSLKLYINNDNNKINLSLWLVEDGINSRLGDYQFDNSKTTITAEDLNNLSTWNNKKVSEVYCEFQCEDLIYANLPNELQFSNFKGGSYSTQNISFKKLNKTDYKLAEGILLNKNDEPFELTDGLITIIDPAKINVDGATVSEVTGTMSIIKNTQNETNPLFTTNSCAIDCCSICINNIESYYGYHGQCPFNPLDENLTEPWLTVKAQEDLNEDCVLLLSNRNDNLYIYFQTLDDYNQEKPAEFVAGKNFSGCDDLTGSMINNILTEYGSVGNKFKFSGTIPFWEIPSDYYLEILLHKGQFAYGQYPPESSKPKFLAISKNIGPNYNNMYFKIQKQNSNDPTIIISLYNNNTLLGTGTKLYYSSTPYIGWGDIAYTELTNNESIYNYMDLKGGMFYNDIPNEGLEIHLSNGTDGSETEDKPLSISLINTNNFSHKVDRVSYFAVSEGTKFVINNKEYYILGIKEILGDSNSYLLSCYIPNTQLPNDSPIPLVNFKFNDSNNPIEVTDVNVIAYAIEVPSEEDPQR